MLTDCNLYYLSYSCYQLNFPEILPSHRPPLFHHIMYPLQDYFLHVPCTSLHPNFRSSHASRCCTSSTIQQLLAPIIAIERVQQEMEKCLYELSDAEDDLLDLNIYGVPPMLRNITHQLRSAITQVKIHKLRLLCQLQPSIYLQWRHHQCFPWLDLDL